MFSVAFLLVISNPGVEPHHISFHKQFLLLEYKKERAEEIGPKLVN